MQGRLDRSITDLYRSFSSPAEVQGPRTLSRCTLGTIRSEIEISNLYDRYGDRSVFPNASQTRKPYRRAFPRTVNSKMRNGAITELRVLHRKSSPYVTTRRFRFYLLTTSSRFDRKKSAVVRRTANFTVIEARRFILSARSCQPAISSYSVGLGRAIEA